MSYLSPNRGDQMIDIQILWGIALLLLGIIGYFIKTTFNRFERKLDEKLDKIICTEKNGSVNNRCDLIFKHKHAPIDPNGRGGEVIIP